MDIGSYINEFIDFVRDYHSTASNAVAWTTLLVYEIAITLAQEIDLVWRSSWSMASLIHIAVRYFSLAYLALNTYVELNTHLSVQFCELYFPFLIWGAAIVVPAADLLVIVRLYALYDRNQKVGLALVLLWLAELGCIFGFIQTSFINVKHDSNPLPGIFSSCFLESYEASLVLKAGIIALAIQIIYLSLALYVMFRKVGIRTINRVPPFIIFFRDGAMYCFVIVVMYIVNILFVTLGNQSPLEFVGAGWLVAIVAISTGRMVLNLKGSVRPKSELWTNYSNDTQESIDEAEYGRFSTLIYTDMTRITSPV